MARKQFKPTSSKKQSKLRKRAPVSSSSSSEDEMPQDPAQAASDRDSHGYGSDASPPRQPSESHRSPERTPRGSSHERSHQSSQDRVSSPRAEHSEDDLQFVSHQPPPEDSSDEAAVTSSTLGDGKFTVPPAPSFSTPPLSPGSSRLQALEAPVSHVGAPVNSSLLLGEQQQPQQATPPQLANKHPQQRNSPGSPVPPANDPSRPATVLSRLSPANSSARRIRALEDNDDGAPADGKRDNSSAGAAQAAPLQQADIAPPKPSPETPEKVEAKKKRAGGGSKPKPEPPVSEALGAPAADILAALASLQAQLKSQEKRLEARERAAASPPKKRKEPEASPPKKRKEPEAPAQPFAALQNPEYLCRFEHLLKAGQRTMAEVADALEATKEAGQYSSGRADFYLKAKANTRIQRTLHAANNNLQDDQEPILENSKLGNLLQAPGNEDAVDIVVKLRDAHARARAKATHCSTPALGAGNLVNLPVVKNDSSMGRKGLTFLSAVAYAVCEDCTKCTILRNRAESEREWKAKQEAESIKKRKKKMKLIKTKRMIKEFYQK